MKKLPYILAAIGILWAGIALAVPGNSLPSQGYNLVPNTTGTLTGASASTSFSFLFSSPYKRYLNGQIFCSVEYVQGTRYATKMNMNGASMRQIYNTSTSQSGLGSVSQWSSPLLAGVSVFTISGSSSVSAAPAVGCIVLNGVNSNYVVDTSTYAYSTTSNATSFSISTSSHYHGELFIDTFVAQGTVNSTPSPKYGETISLDLASGINSYGVSFIFQDSPGTVSTGWTTPFATSGTLATIGIIPDNQDFQMMSGE